MHKKNFFDLALFVRAWYARVLLSCGSFELVLLLVIGEEDDTILHVSEAADW